MPKTYFKSAYDVSFPPLESDIEADVAIIGGGLAGLLCAESLNACGKRVVVLEADRVGEGVTQNSSAMLSFCHDLVYARLIKKHGLKLAESFLSLQKEGMERIRKIIKKYSIDCDYQDCAMRLFSTEKKGAKKLIKEQNAYLDLGQKTVFSTDEAFPPGVIATLKVDGQGYLNPLSFIKGLADSLSKAGVQIFEKTLVKDQPDGNTLKVGKYLVTAQSFVVAAHFPFLNFPGFYFTKMYQSRSHNIAFKTDVKIEDIYESVEEDGFEYRPLKDGILCGGANIRTGKYKHRSQYKIVEEHICKDLGAKKENIIAEFSAEDCMTFDFLPFVGRYSHFLDNIYVISGFNKWGFSNAAAAAGIITKLVLKEELEENIFAPNRMYFLKTPIKSARNLGTLLASFANVVLSTDAKKFRRIKEGQGAIVRYKGKRLGVYRETNGKLKAISAICPHLGCSLRYNKDEKSWDCPCHGSRFDVNGRILDGPATEKAVRVRIGDEKDI